MIIEFEDHNQDFLRWEIDEDAMVIDCQPFQRRFWCGLNVLNKDALKVGGFVEIDGHHGAMTIKYPIKSIKE